MSEHKRENPVSDAGPDDSPIWGDVSALAAAIGGDFDAARVCLPSHRFRAPLAPPVAARMENASISLPPMLQGARWWQGKVDLLLVEGVGGLLCPLTDDETVADLAVALGFPIIVVGRLGLGTINHTLLTVEAARSRGLTVAGVILNEAEPLATTLGIDQNPVEIARRTNAPVLGVVRHGGTIPTVDWLALAGKGMSNDE